MAGLQYVTASAVMPEQVLPYVAAVSGCRTQVLGECVCHRDGQDAVLVAYPLHNAMDTSHLDQTVRHAVSLPGLARLTVLAPQRPACAPAHAVSTEDIYWAVDLPPAPPQQKLRHLVYRAMRDITITHGCGPGTWTSAHADLAYEYIRTRPFAPGTRHIFTHLGKYVDNAPQACVFSAYTHDATLTACVIGDFSSLSTALYMFAFRSKIAPPGTADALLDALLQEATQRGHSRCNLGLGITPGVAFFKKKWQAYAFLPCVQTTWTMQETKTSWWKRLLQ